MSDNLAPFLGGFLFVGGWNSITTWLNHIHLLKISPELFVAEYGIKVLGTVFIGFFGGLSGMLAKDFYRWSTKLLKKDDSKIM